MAQGDVHIYEKFLERLGDAQINLSSAVVKCALTTSAGGVPGGGVTASNPGWDVSFTQDLSANEVTAGGGYAADGVAIDGTDPWTLTTNKGVYTGDNAAWTSSGSGDPTNIGYGVFYVADATATLRYAIGYVEVWDGVTPVSLLAGNVTIKWSGGASTGIVFDMAGA